MTGIQCHSTTPGRLLERAIAAYVLEEQQRRLQRLRANRHWEDRARAALQRALAAMGETADDIVIYDNRAEVTIDGVLFIWRPDLAGLQARVRCAGGGCERWGEVTRLADLGALALEVQERCTCGADA